MTSSTPIFQTSAEAENPVPCTVVPAKPTRLDGHLVIRSDWHQCLVVQELMASCARTYEFDELAVRKAVMAALANAFKHGNGGAPEKCIRVDYEMNEMEFRVSIADEGSGFDYGAVSVPSSRGTSGRGLGLMRHYMTAVCFNECGNRVELSRRKTRVDC